MVRLGGPVALSAQAERAAVVTGLLVRLGGLRIRRMADGLSVRRTADTGLPLGWAAGFLFVALCFFFGTTRLLVQIRHTADWGGCARRLRPRPFRRTARFLMGTAAHALSPPRRSAAHGCRQAAWCCLPWVRRTADARRGTRRVRLGGFCSYIGFGYERGLVHGYGWYFVNPPYGG